MYWLMALISFLKIGSRQQEASRPSDATWELDAALHSRRAARHRRSPLLSANPRQSHVDQTPVPGHAPHYAGGGRTAEFGRFPAGCARHTPDVRADPAGATRADVLARPTTPDLPTVPIISPMSIWPTPSSHPSRKPAPVGKK